MYSSYQATKRITVLSAQYNISLHGLEYKIIRTLSSSYFCTLKNIRIKPHAWISYAELAAKQQSGYYCRRNVAIKSTQSDPSAWKAW